MHRSQFCTARETILTKLTNPKGFYFEEGSFHGATFATVEEAVASLGMEHAAAYLRFDLDTLSAEDVTEEFAAQWLTKFEGTPDDEDRSLPLYVRTSQAWDDWCSDFIVENGLAFTQRSHGTLNHRQQFGA